MKLTKTNIWQDRHMSLLRVVDEKSAADETKCSRKIVLMQPDWQEKLFAYSATVQIASGPH